MRTLVPVLLLAASTSLAHAGKPSVTVANVQVSGKVDAKVVTAALKKANPKLLACFKQDLAAGPTEADIEVTFSVEANGTVATATVPTPNPSLSTCVAGVLTKLMFAKPKDGMPAGVSMRMRFYSGTVKTGAFASITGDAEVYGGLGGNWSEAQLGGGGTGLGTIGIGTGRPPETGTGTGYGPLGSSGIARPTGSTAMLGTPKITGDLDPAIVRRYLKQHINRFRFCYDQELQASPRLAGTLTLDFTINADGKVAAAAGKGVHADVEACVTSAVKTITFPKPTTPTDVTVSYPITFRPGAR
ncbi:MAG: AgmX/PglI C-terminal domain-containing protein [Kofleriaceae bacterium]|nr:AgmX/PglI C-terminal domain-containing protein [Kofleriaceae bacterium]